MSEQRTITITAYRTPEGAPTCAVNFDAGEVCKLLQTTRYGMTEVCALQTGRRVGLDRGMGGNGYLIPCAECIVWSAA